MAGNSLDVVSVTIFGTGRLPSVRQCQFPRLGADVGRQRVGPRVHSCSRWLDEHGGRESELLCWRVLLRFRASPAHNLKEPVQGLGIGHRHIVLLSLGHLHSLPLCERASDQRYTSNAKSTLNLLLEGDVDWGNDRNVPISHTSSMNIIHTPTRHPFVYGDEVVSLLWCKTASLIRLCAFPYMSPMLFY